MRSVEIFVGRARAKARGLKLTLKNTSAHRVFMRTVYFNRSVTAYLVQPTRAAVAAAGPSRAYWAVLL